MGRKSVASCDCGANVDEASSVAGHCSLECAMTAHQDLAAKHTPGRPRAIVFPSSKPPRLPERCVHCFAPAAATTLLSFTNTPGVPMPKLLRAAQPRATEVQLEVPVCASCARREILVALGGVSAIFALFAFFARGSVPVPLAVPAVLLALAVGFVLFALRSARGAKAVQAVGIFAPGARNGATGEVYLTFSDLAWGEVVATLNDTRTVRLNDSAIPARG